MASEEGATEAYQCLNCTEIFLDLVTEHCLDRFGLCHLHASVQGFSDVTEAECP